jgi:bacterioferritin-associated ferredoxin
VLTIVLIQFYDGDAMYLCVCKAVSERTARRAIHEEGVMSLRELSRRHGVGTGCGKCVPAARELLQSETSACMSQMPAANFGAMSAASTAA